MFTQRFLIPLFPLFARLPAFRDVKLHANHSIVLVAVLLTFAVGACGGTDTTPASTSTASEKQASDTLSGVGVGPDYGLGEEFDLLVLMFAEAIHEDPHDPNAYNGRAAAYISVLRHKIRPIKGVTNTVICICF